MTVNDAISQKIVIKIEVGYLLLCFLCGKKRILKTRENVRRALKYNRKCNSCSNGIKTKGRDLSLDTKQKMSKSQSIRYSDNNQKIKTSDVVKKAMYRPEVRKKHIESLFSSKWLKVKTDKGQLELIEKWNRLGFNFEPNYQIKTDFDLFYIDGYDKDKNVILEYDSKYHFRLGQHKKDLDRQNKIIKLLNPKAFWRYNSVKGMFIKVYYSK